MKRFSACGFWAFVGLASTGCPVYSDDPTCYDSYDCPGNLVCSYDGFCVVPDYGGYAGSGGGSGRAEDAGREVGAADAGLADGATDAAADGARQDGAASDAAPHDGAPPGDGTAPVYCGNPNDCAAGQTCASDTTCHSGDCGENACINQFECARTVGGLACVPGNPLGCGDDGTCTFGQRCVDGTCTALGDLCSDRTQCPEGDACVDGKCVRVCALDAQCLAGFRCLTALGVCAAAAKACANTSDCGDPLWVCVDHACVPRCTASGACADGKGACVENGCVPSQKVVVQCGADGQSTGCGAGQICLHHHCYLSCEPPNDGACSAQAKLTVCKTVTTSSGAHAVCGSSENLGSECDPTAERWCAGKTCVDGFCK